MKIKALVVLMLTVFLLPATGVRAGEENVVLPDIPRISVEELKKMVDEGGDFVVLDVRDAGSYSAGHIKGAVNIYYDSTADPMERQMMLLALPMDKLIVTYCDCTDDASSATIADELYILGYEREKIKVLSGGSLRWVELGYPMVPSN
ncbi:MAG: rhodanese-like domain-containing protein [Acidobacteria bacterium]|nr:rhodanese-like domain-containing protein [Acidobacteriota bacterium]